MIASARDQHVDQGPVHISTVFLELFEQLDFRMAANSPDPEARQAAHEQLIKAGYLKAEIQACIACWRAGARREMNGRLRA